MRITVDNIEQVRGTLTISSGDLPFDMWQIFDRSAFDALPLPLIVPMSKLVSTKNQLLDPKFVSGEKPDPRQTAFERMLAAAHGLAKRREPLKAAPKSDGTFHVQDGNATVQVLMFAGWKEAPIEATVAND